MIVCKLQVGREGVFEDVDVRVVADRRDKGRFNGEAGGVAAGVEDSGAGVGRFQTLGEFAVVPVEGDAEADEIRNPGWTFFAEGADGCGAAEAGSGAEGVFDVLGHVVVGVHDGGNAALGVAGVGLVEGGFCDEGDLVSAAQFECGDESGDARAYDDDVHGCWCLGGLDVRGWSWEGTMLIPKQLGFNVSVYGVEDV